MDTEVMDSMEEMDLEYRQTLRRIQLIVPTLTSRETVWLVATWINILHDQCEANKYVRNSYILELEHQLATGSLSFPFTSIPYSGDLTPLERERFVEIEEEVIFQRSNPSVSSQVELGSLGRGDSYSSGTAMGSILEEDSAMEDPRLDLLCTIIDNLQDENTKLQEDIKKVESDVEQKMSHRVYEVKKQLAIALLKNNEMKDIIQTLEKEKHMLSKNDCPVILYETHEEIISKLDEKHTKELREMDENVKKERDKHIQEASKVISASKDELKMQFEKMEIDLRRKYLNMIERKFNQFTLIDNARIEEITSLKVKNEILRNRSDCAKTEHETALHAMDEDFENERQQYRSLITRLQNLLFQKCSRMQKDITDLRTETDTTYSDKIQLLTKQAEFFKDCMHKLECTYKEAVNEFANRVSQVETDCTLRTKTTKIMMTADKVECISQLSAKHQKKFCELTDKLHRRFKFSLSNQLREYLVTKKDRNADDMVCPSTSKKEPQMHKSKRYKSSKLDLKNLRVTLPVVEEEPANFEDTS